jgi:hypothetical protein
MLNSEQNPEVSDTTEDDSSNRVKQKIKKPPVREAFILLN